MRLGKQIFRCWRKGRPWRHESGKRPGAFRDVYFFYLMAQRMGIDKIRIFRARFPVSAPKRALTCRMKRPVLCRQGMEKRLQGLGPWRNLQRFNRPGLYPCYAGADDRLRRGHAQWRRSPQAPALETLRARFGAACQRKPKPCSLWSECHAQDGGQRPARIVGQGMRTWVARRARPGCQLK